MDVDGKVLGKNYFRDEQVNEGFYSKKREGVADVDPKVIQKNNRLFLGHGALRSYPSKASKEGRNRQTTQAFRIARHRRPAFELCKFTRILSTT